jgi:hypothetical protein
MFKKRVKEKGATAGGPSGATGTGTPMKGDLEIRAYRRVGLSLYV